MKVELDRSVRDFITPVEAPLRQDLTVAQAVDNLRTRVAPDAVNYFYVVDENDKLQGVLAARKLLLSDAQVRLADIMDRPVVSIPHSFTLGDAMEEFALRRLLALPVVDDEGRLLGTIDVQLYAEEAVDLAEANRVADLFQLMGLSVQLLRKGGTWRTFRARLPWLLLNIISGLVCAVIAAAFQSVLLEYVLLAMFIPLVLTLSESISMQSMTITLQHLHGGGSAMRRVRMRFAAEWKTAALMALSCAILVGAAATLWPRGGQAAGVIFLSIFMAMLFSASLGAVLPAILHSVKLDPKVAAGPTVLMIADILTTAIYLGSATLLLLH